MRERKIDLEKKITRYWKISADRAISEARAGAEDHAKAWKIIGELREEEDRTVPIATDHLVRHFTEVFSPASSPPVPAPVPDAPTPTHLLHLVDAITPEEFDQAIRDTNLTSAPGPDGLSPKLLIDALKVDAFYVFLFQFMLMCFVLSYVPTQWREAQVFILYKGRGNPLDPNSYRGISLTSIMAKMYERVLLSRLQAWSATTMVANLPQFGFRKGCSTIHAVFMLQTVVHEVVSIARRPLYAIFVDLTKAFPSIDRDAMFKFLFDRGVPTHLLKAIRSFYVANKARLRIDNLLTIAINVTLGVLEGSCLSPFLFSTVFSVIWDFVSCSNFPSGQPRILNLGRFWLIAFADDVVILSTSFEELQEVLGKLFDELKKFNLAMNLIKTESLTFLPPRMRTPGPSQTFEVNGIQLSQVAEFKYLGIFVSARWGFSGHITRMHGRAEAAASELIRLAARLDIRRADRLAAYFRALVDSQWHGIELLPVSVVKEIETVRSHFTNHLFNLPCSTATLLSLVVLDLWPAAYMAMARRISFWRKMRDHELQFVRDSFDFDRTALFIAHVGWHHEAFLLFRSMFSREKVAEFSFERVEARLSRIANARAQFVFSLLQVSDEATLAPFRLFQSHEVLVSFRSFLGQISKSSADTLLLCCSSGHRFRFFNRPALRCPLCASGSWLTSHLFSCKMVEPILSRNGVTLTEFENGMRVGDWKAVLFFLAESLTLWKNSFTDCLLEDCVIQGLLTDANLL